VPKPAQSPAFSRSIARSITAAGKRIPGLKLDNPRQLALMHALVRFSHIAAGNSFTTARDPYMAISEGRLYWIQDAYTTSAWFPYAKSSE
jgi:Uncharacterised protein family (UPF0182)